MATYKKFTGATGFFECLTCKEEFPARLADRERGWARYCSKSCKATKQASRLGYGENFKGRQESRNRYGEDELCFPSMAEGDVQ